MELNHNIGFSIGDYVWDGHCLYQEYHIVSNYSGEKISKAYQELSSKLGWNFLEECRGYEVLKLEMGTRNRVPEIYELRQSVRELINKLIDENLVEIQCGGLRVRKGSESIIVTFEVESLEV